MYSPPSPPSPPTPDWIIRERQEKQRKAREERERKETHIRLNLVNLNKYNGTEKLIALLAEILRSDMDLDKKYKISEAICSRADNQDLDSENSRALVSQHLKEDALNPESSLYHALNFQRSFFGLTFWGEMQAVGCNYARTLQKIHVLLKEEQEALNVPSVVEMK